MAVIVGERAGELFRVLDSLELPDGYRAEILEEEIVVSPTPSGLHQRNVRELVKQLSRHLPEGHDVEDFLEIRIPGLGRSIIPDAFVAPESVLTTPAHRIPPDHVILVGEVVSNGNPANDRERKVGLYAAAGIPLYLLIDPLKATTTLYSSPADEVYLDHSTLHFGKDMWIPEPFGFELTTALFHRY